jgi:hypothetical protein
MRSLPLVLASVSAAIVLSACGGPAPGSTFAPDAGETASATPTPTPTPAPPRLEELTLTTEGLGTLVFGTVADADPATRMIFFDPEACVFDGGPVPGSPEAANWVPIDAYGTEGSRVFGVNAQLDGTVDRIDLFDGTIPTDRGLHIGDSRADALAAYPDAEVTHEWATDVLVVHGTAGDIHIEIGHNTGDAVGYWEPHQVDRVLFIRGLLASFPTFTVAGSGNIAGGCL